MNLKITSNNNKVMSEFIEQVNSTPRKLGHNKLQLEIEKLNQEIEQLKLSNSQKDTKVLLFSKTITALQTQLKESNGQVGPPKEEKNTENDELVYKQEIEISNYRKQLEESTVQQCNMKNESDEKTNIITNLDKDIVDLKNQLLMLKDFNDNKVKEHKEIEEKLMTIEQDNVMKTNIVDNVQSELVTLRNENEKLQNKIQEQALYITELESMKIQVNNTEISQEPIQTEVPKISGYSVKPKRGDRRKRN